MKWLKVVISGGQKRDCKNGGSQKILDMVKVDFCKDLVNFWGVLVGCVGVPDGLCCAPSKS